MRHFLYQESIRHCRGKTSQQHAITVTALISINQREEIQKQKKFESCAIICLLTDLLLHAKTNFGAKLSILHFIIYSQTALLIKVGIMLRQESERMSFVSFCVCKYPVQQADISNPSTKIFPLTPQRLHAELTMEGKKLSEQ